MLTDMRLGPAAFIVMICALSSPLRAAEKTVWDGVYTIEQAERGQTLFDRLCSACHGRGLTGTPGGPPLKGADFAYSFGDKTLLELIEFIKARMPVEAPGSLSSQQATNLTAHLLRGNGFPAGDHDLVPDSDDLLDITIKVAK